MRGRPDGDSRGHQAGDRCPRLLEANPDPEQNHDHDVGERDAAGEGDRGHGDQHRRQPQRLGADPRPALQSGTPREDQQCGRHDEIATEVAKPPDAPRRRNLTSGDEPGRPQARHADGRADRRAQQSREDDQRKDVPDPLQGRAKSRHPRQQKATDNGLEGVPGGDREDAPVRTGGSDVGEEGPNSDRRPHPVAPDEHRGQRNAGGRPDGADALVREGEGEPRLGRAEIGGAEDRQPNRVHDPGAHALGRARRIRQAGQRTSPGRVVVREPVLSLTSIGSQLEGLIRWLRPGHPFLRTSLNRAPLGARARPRTSPSAPLDPDLQAAGTHRRGAACAPIKRSHQTHGNSRSASFPDQLGGSASTRALPARGQARRGPAPPRLSRAPVRPGKRKSGDGVERDH